MKTFFLTVMRPDKIVFSGEAADAVFLHGFSFRAPV